MMRRTTFLLVVVLSVVAFGQSRYNDPHIKGRPSESNLVFFGRSGALIDSGVSHAELRSLIDAYFSLANGPGQLLKLDENGKIDADVIETIVIATAGGYYQP